MPNLKSLKALRKLMQEEGLLQQLEKAKLQRGDRMAADELIRKVRKEGMTDEALSEARKLRTEPYGIDQSVNEQINLRGGQKYENPRQAAFETQKGTPVYFEPEGNLYEGTVHEGWPRETPGFGEYERPPNEHRLQDLGIYEHQADSLRALKNYPSKNLEENERARQLFAHRKEYPEMPYNEEVPQLWQDVLKSKTEDKWNEIKRMLEKKKSE